MSLQVKHQGAFIGHGQVRHVRLRPSHHAFHYGAFFLMLPMRLLQKNASQANHDLQLDLAINRPGVVSFLMSTTVMADPRRSAAHWRGWRSCC